MNLLGSYKPHVLVYDPDDVLQRPNMQKAILANGFKMQTCANVHMLQTLWATHTTAEKLLVTTQKDFDLPNTLVPFFDKKRLNYAYAFPNLTPSVLRTLSDDILEILDESATRLTQKQTVEQTTLFVEKAKTTLLFQQKERKRHTFEVQLEQIRQFVKQQNTNVREWLAFMPTVAQAKIFVLENADNALKQTWKTLEKELNDTFQILLKTYPSASLSRMSYLKQPFSVSQILPYIETQKHAKTALLVLDGLSLWQWQLLANKLSENSIECQEKATFAWIPTITAWSRQSIFRGAPPQYDTDSSIENAIFKAFWQSKGLFSSDVEYNKTSLRSNFDTTEYEQKKALGIVVNDIDEQLHGVTMGEQQLYHFSKQWLQEGCFVEFITHLKQEGFKIYLTSDHGSIEAEGIGSLRNKEKVFSLSRSKRHIRFENAIAQAEFVKNHPAIHFGQKDLSLYLTQNEAFAYETLVVTHGGSHFWEVIVPFIEI